jgi:hypothetical protein
MLLVDLVSLAVARPPQLLHECAATTMQDICHPVWALTHLQSLLHHGGGSLDCLANNWGSNVIALYTATGQMLDQTRTCHMFARGK